MPAEPIKLTILKALTAHLEGIVGPDYHDFDLRGRVSRGRGSYGKEMGDDPFLSIIEAPRPDNGREAGENRASRSFEWPLFIQGWTRTGEEHPTDSLYFFLDALESRLNMIVDVDGRSGFPIHPPSIYMLNGLITSLSFGPGVVRQPTEGVSSTAFLYCPLRVGMATIG